MVDVLQVNGADIIARGKVLIIVAAPKLKKDRQIGEYLEWETTFNLPVENLLYYEGLDNDFYDFDTGLEKYRKAVEKGVRIAKKL